MRFLELQSCKLQWPHGHLKLIWTAGINAQHYHLAINTQQLWRGTDPAFRALPAHSFPPRARQRRGASKPGMTPKRNSTSKGIAIGPGLHTHTHKVPQGDAHPRHIQQPPRFRSAQQATAGRGCHFPSAQAGPRDSPAVQCTILKTERPEPIGAVCYYILLMN